MIGEAMNIEDFIPEGREDAISRADLHRITGLPDRTIRLEIKRANLRLEPQNRAILSSSAARGYWISGDRMEMEAYLRESERRQNVTAQNDMPIFRIVMAMAGDKVIPVRRHFRNLTHPKRPEIKQIDGQLSID